MWVDHERVEIKRIDRAGCVGTTVRTWSGRYLDIVNPSPEDIYIDDIACGLAKICRFGGQIGAFYSVADHSINAFLLAEHWGYGRDVQLAALMHDASEAYIGDVIRPLKVLLQRYIDIESGIQSAIRSRFNVHDTFETEGPVRDIDKALLFEERNTFFPRDGVKWEGEDDVRSVDKFVLRRGFPYAETVFKDVFRRLCK